MQTKCAILTHENRKKMTLLGALVTIIGFALLWLTPFIGGFFMLAGMAIIWVSEDQRIRGEKQRKRIEEEIEEEFDKLKYDEPTSAKAIELATLLHGSLKPYETWLLEEVESLEKLYSYDSETALEEIRNVKTGKFKSLFSESEKYIGICEFLKREIIVELIEDFQKLLDQDVVLGVETDSNIDDILTDYDLEEWVKKQLTVYEREKKEREEIIKLVKAEAFQKFKKVLTISCVNSEWIINGNIKIAANKK